MTDDSISSKAVRGAGWAFCWRMATRLLGLVSTLVLVRLLAPGDFGLVALAAAFANAVDALSNTGTDYALIREKSLDRDLYDTAFTMNLVKGVLTAVIIAGAAIPVGAFLNEPRLGSVLFALAIINALASVENIGIVDFRRDFAFGQEFKLFLLPRLLGIAANIIFAFWLRSYWALVIGVAVTRLGRSVFSYVMHSYRPSLGLAAWRQLLGFSFWVWASSLITLVRERADNLVIGRMLDSTRVGFFSVGTEIAQLPTSEIMGPVARSLFPAFAALEHGGGGMGRAYLRAVGVVMMVVMPACLGLSALADPLVRLAFGANWLATTPVIQVVAVTGISFVITQTTGAAFGVRGDMHLVFWLGVPGAILRVPLMVMLVISHDLLGAALALALLAVLELGLNAVVSARRLEFGLDELWLCMWRCVIATVVMCGVLYALGLGWTEADGDRIAQTLRLLSGSLLGGAVFGVTVLALWLAAGRPQGAETTLLGYVVRALGWMRRR